MLLYMYNIVRKRSSRHENRIGFLRIHPSSGMRGTMAGDRWNELQRRYYRLWLWFIRALGGESGP